MNLLMLLKCNGLAYDDRVRKESVTLSNIGYDISIHVLEDKNKYSSGVIFNDSVKFKKYYLITRKLFRGNQFLILKLLEFFCRFVFSTFKRYDVVWLHDPLMFVFIPYFYFLKKIGRVDKIVWDQHELPPQYFLRFGLMRRLYKFSMGVVDVRIHANEERALYLNGILEQDYSYKIVRNFVDESFISEKALPLPKDVLSWLNGEGYFLLQSGAYEVRNFSYLVEAICTSIKMKCIVVGGYDNDYISNLRSKYNNFDDLIFFVGMVPQVRLVDYIDEAKASVIFYNNKEPNSLLCEPNRLYQAISRGTPVIVGSNPPMARIVNELNCGIVLANCGSSVETIIEAFSEFSKSSIHVASSAKNKFIWDSQLKVFDL
ncbi:glycosyltransferase [Shewanella algae]|uniref:glycosyltransferase n=1 Tax=Shewanella algae TaxID=38313 RepID=UPI0031F584D5